MKVGILLESQAVTEHPKDFVSKSGAEAMCRRLTHVRVSKFLIQAVSIRQFRTNLSPVKQQVAPIWCREGYQHHLEPRLESIGFADSAWMRYLHGYPFSERAEG